MCDIDDRSQGAGQLTRRDVLRTGIGAALFAALPSPLRAERWHVELEPESRYLDAAIAAGKWIRAMAIDAPDEPWIEYRSERTDPRGAPAAFRGRYRARGGHRHADPGSLEAWLVERYRLYTVDGGRVYAGDIHHRPWTLQDAEADIEANTMAAPVGLDLDGEPLVQYAARQDVVFWPLVRIEAG